MRTFASMLVDTHTHLYVDAFDDDRTAMLQRAFEAGVERLYLPNIDEASIEDMHQLATAHPGAVFPMMGLHPCSVKDDFEQVLDRMASYLEKGGYAGIGETGLDYYWDMTYQTQQQASLVRHIAWAKQYRLPIILHTRDAFADTFALIEKHYDEQLTGIFHCFSGTLEEARQVLALDGFYLGIGGVLTFKNSGLDKVVAELPLDRLVLESDSPYLTPAPHRGKRNESSYLRLVAEKLAVVKGVSVKEIEAITTANADKVFASSLQMAE